MRFMLILALTTFGACEVNQGDQSWRFDMSCNGLSTNARGAVACIRLDSVSGDVHFIDIDKLSTLGASTASKQATGNNGQFGLACGVSNTPREATMRCVRLNRTSGEMVLLDLSRLPRLPAQPVAK